MNQNWILFIMAAFLTLPLLFYLFCVIPVQSLPLYGYFDFAWHKNGTEVIYRKEILSDISPQSQETKAHEIKMATVDAKQRTLAYFLNYSEHMKLLGFDRYGNEFYYYRPQTHAVYKIGLFSPASVTEHTLPIKHGENVIFSQGVFFFCHENTDSVDITIAYGISDFQTNLIHFPKYEGDVYHLVDASLSFDGNYAALAVCHKSRDNYEGITTLYLSDIHKRIYHKSNIASYSNLMETAWAPNQNILTVKTYSYTNGIKKAQIAFLNPAKSAITPDYILEANDYGEFSLFWSDQDKLFLITDDKIYVVRKIYDEFDARLIFDRFSLPVRTDEFYLSPSGQRVLLVKYADGPNGKSEAWLCDLSGTQCKRLIPPEGRRKYDDDIVYQYLKNCRQVVIDLWNALHKK